MGAGRKTETYTLKEKSQPASSVNCSVTARNLRKSELGGVIFGCKHTTIKECFSNQLFGLPAAHISYVKHIVPGLPLFLFNYSDRKLHGVFEAASFGRLNINPHGWTVDGLECTPFAAQVRIQIRMLCQPLLEVQFGPVIADNYFEPRLFWFELDRDQTNKLISMFSSSPVTASVAFPESTAKQSTVLKAACLSETRQKGGGTERFTLDEDVSNQEHNIDGGSCGGVIGLSVQSNSLECSAEYLEEHEQFTCMIPDSGRSYLSVVKNSGNSIVHSKQAHSGQSSLGNPGLGEDNRSLDNIYNEEAVEHCVEISDVGHSYLPDMGKISASIAQSDVQQALAKGQSTSSQKKWSDLFETSAAPAGRLEVTEMETLDSELNLCSSAQFNSTWESSSVRPGSNGKRNSSKDFIDESGEYDEQFECLKQQMEDLYLSVATEAASCLPQSTPCESLSMAYARWEAKYLDTRASEGNTSWSDRSEIENSCSSEADLLLDAKSPGLQFIVDKILQEFNKLKLNQFKQDQKISSLEKDLAESGREIKSLKQQLKTSDCSSLRETNCVIESESNVDQSILLVGGFNGSSFVSALDCYCPSRDLLESLCPMSSIRSYTSAVKLNGEVYVFGGLHDNLWYDTVESYNLLSNQWVTRPSLSQKKGSLAGISLNEKIFAIGGGNGVQCFSEVEMLDLDVGRWIPTRSMLHKRFAPAAAEINRMLYVVGGYDGNEYLKSVERFDPREYSWTKLESMSTKRGCHSLAVLNDKLYAMGGYDGERMISTVEVYDPRKGSWIMGESMNICRGYSAAVVIGNSIFTIGGLNEDNVVLDMVECYKEGRGWQSTDLKAIGKRCFFSAILL